MSTVLYNPTNEFFTGTYIGEDTIIGPDEKVKVDDARGKHLLNQLGRRGLIPLDFGDEGEIFEKKKAAALARNKEFKEKQVADYNRNNLFRKQQNLEYLQPPEQIQNYAKDLGLELVQPYMPKDQRTPEIERLQRENAEKDREMGDMKRQMNELLVTMQQLTAQVASRNEKKSKGGRPPKNATKEDPEATGAKAVEKTA